MTAELPDPALPHAVHPPRRDADAVMWTVSCLCGAAAHDLDRDAAEAAMQVHQVGAGDVAGN